LHLHVNAVFAIDPDFSPPQVWGTLTHRGSGIGSARDITSPAATWSGYRAQAGRRIIRPVAKGVGRFQVKATLQAARAQALGLSADSAKSWGLNRAIYYAAAKRGFKEASTGRTPRAPKGARRVFEHYFGDDKAYAVKSRGKMLFTIGGEIQRADDFRKQIEARFAGTFADAWKEAAAIIGAHPREILESQNGFYMKVYRPRRDVLAGKWNERAEKQAAS